VALETLALVLVACAGFGFLGVASYLAEKNPLSFLSVSQSIYVNTASKNLLGSLNPISKLSLYTVEYPLLFLTMTPVALWFGKQNKLRGILQYFGTSLTVILTAGLLLNVIFGWARYFIPLIPVCLILVGPMVLRSKYWSVWGIPILCVGRLWYISAGSVCDVFPEEYDALMDADFKSGARERLSNPKIANLEEPFLNGIADRSYRHLHPDVATSLALLSSGLAFCAYIQAHSNPLFLPVACLGRW